MLFHFKWTNKSNIKMYKINIQLQRRIRRNKYKLIRALCMGVILIIFLSIFVKLLSLMLKSDPVEDASCHYVETGNILPVADCNFWSMPDTIYFHLTTCPVRMNSRLACAIESAALANPYWPIAVLVSGPLTKGHLKDPSLIILDKLWNINFYRVIIGEYAQGTKLEPLISSGTLNKSYYSNSHSRDILKYLTMYKWGGIVLDFNMIVARPLRGLGMNWAISNGRRLRSEAMALSRDLDVGQSISYTAVRILSESYKPGREENGARVITEAARTICDPKNPEKNHVACHEFNILPPNTTETVDFFSKSIDLEKSNAFMYRIMNLPNESISNPIQKGSAYAQLAQKYCPNIYNTFRDNFGI